MVLEASLARAPGGSAPSAEKGESFRLLASLTRAPASIPFSVLKVGQTVEVEGRTQANGSVLATKVKVDG